MTTDDELRNLIPALPEPIEFTAGYDGYWVSHMEAYALATARAVWAAAIERDSQWISVKDRLPPMLADADGPRISDAVLVANDGYAHLMFGHVLYYPSGRTEWRAGGLPSNAPVTHWMPLPKAPAAIRSIGSGEQT